MMAAAFTAAAFGGVSSQAEAEAGKPAGALDDHGTFVSVGIEASRIVWILTAALTAEAFLGVLVQMQAAAASRVGPSYYDAFATRQAALRGSPGQLPRKALPQESGLRDSL